MRRRRWVNPAARVPMTQALLFPLPRTPSYVSSFWVPPLPAEKISYPRRFLRREWRHRWLPVIYEVGVAAVVVALYEHSLQIQRDVGVRVSQGHTSAGQTALQ